MLQSSGSWYQERRQTTETTRILSGDSSFLCPRCWSTERSPEKKSGWISVRSAGETLSLSTREDGGAAALCGFLHDGPFSSGTLVHHERTLISGCPLTDSAFVQASGALETRLKSRAVPCRLPQGSRMFPQSRHPTPHQAPGQPFKFTIPESLDRIKEEFQFLQAQYHSLKLECEKLASEKTEMQRHYVMYYEMSYGLNIEMHKQ
ncbi:hypothetical protein Z043_101438, partial [Scleropages formosus]